MEKKEYIKPEMTVYQIKAPTILQATSSIRDGTHPTAIYGNADGSPLPGPPQGAGVPTCCVLGGLNGSFPLGKVGMGPLCWPQKAPPGGDDDYENLDDIIDADGGISAD